MPLLLPTFFWHCWHNPSSSDAGTLPKSDNGKFEDNYQLLEGKQQPIPSPDSSEVASTLKSQKAEVTYLCSWKSQNKLVRGQAMTRHMEIEVFILISETEMSQMTFYICKKYIALPHSYLVREGKWYKTHLLSRWLTVTESHVSLLVLLNSFCYVQVAPH